MNRSRFMLGSMSGRHRSRGVTIVEVLVVLAVIALLVAVTLPSAATVGCNSFRAQSRANLATLAQAHAAYASVWNDRQFTMVPDAVGAFGGCANFVAQGNCLPDVALGAACDGGAVSIPLGCGPSACENIAFAKAIEFGGPNAGFGAYRLPNAAGFQPFVDGRFYSSAFYAPDDYEIIDQVQPLLSSPCGFSGNPQQIVYASYCLSPAAMWGLGVLSRQSGYKNPDSLATGYTSPSVNQCTYPSLKTRMMEFRAVDVDCFLDPAGCGSYQFNQMYESRSLGLFFDGSVHIVTPREAMESDQRAKLAAVGLVEKGLWIRGTPLGPNGVGGSESYDFLTDTSFHLLTGDGIAGRDILNW
jgi:prepilin-type N-terminal cleavage/methylation domain-containing protein